MCIEKVVVRKSGEELYSKSYQSPTAPQSQNTATSDTRKSVDHSDKHGGTYRETCRGEVDFRKQGLPHSAVQEHDHIRKQAVQKLIHQFEKSPEQRSTTRRLMTKERVQSVQREVEGYDLQTWETWSASRFARSLQSYNAPTVWHTGRKLFKVRKLNSDRYDVLSIRNYVIN